MKTATWFGVDFSMFSHRVSRFSIASVKGTVLNNLSRGKYQVMRKNVRTSYLLILWLMMMSFDSLVKLCFSLDDLRWTFLFFALRWNQTRRHAVSLRRTAMMRSRNNWLTYSVVWCVQQPGGRTFKWNTLINWLEDMDGSFLRGAGSYGNLQSFKKL